ncbi:hypothetical protein B6U80_00040 [Candidatus Pacearchaeota archaeon ex4484_26]|nr:MAG: hypothetical protein B6U80_00040 [Candidatus Pacearchaeota archaeon ex4484_26]
MNKRGLTRRAIITFILVLFIFIIIALAVVGIIKDVFHIEISKTGETKLVEETPIECITDDDCPVGMTCENGICVGEAEEEGFLYSTE